jgi:GT2 family glycosyltransferase
VIRSIRAQTRAPDRVVCVDTASRDRSAELLDEALGAAAVLRLERNYGFGTAVRRALAALPDTDPDTKPDADPDAPADDPPDDPADAAPPRTDWIWLLHDDSAPDPGALRALLELAADMPSAQVLGPKCLSWNGEYVLEAGLSIDPSGRRYTGVDGVELDQGQHDRVRDVLAVGSAGALIRRDLWDHLGGYDRALPRVGADLDFGWRATRSGARVVVAPRATVRHASAMHRGLRRHAPTGWRVRRLERRAGLRTALVNASPVGFAVGLPRLVLGALLRALALLLLRRPGAALDEVAVTIRLLANPTALLLARHRRWRSAREPHAAVRTLLASPATRLRRDWDGLAGVFGWTGRPEPSPPRGRWAALPESGPVSEEVEALDTGGAGLPGRLARTPAAWLVLALAAVTLVADRHLLGGTLAGGGLPRPTGGAGDLWSAYLSGWHDIGAGSSAPPSPALAVLAALSTVCLGKPWLAVDLVLLGAVPLAGITAYRAAGRLIRTRALRIWAAATWALLPVATGAVATGQLGVLVALVVGPPTAAAAARSLTAPPRSGRASSAIATGLGLAVVAAFSPVLFLTAVALLLPFALVRGGRAAATVAVIVAVPPLLLLPWTGYAATHPAALIAGFGLPAAGSPVSPLRLALGLAPGARVLALGVTAPLIVLALAGLLRAGRLAGALTAWWAAAVGLGAAIALDRLSVTTAAGVVRGWPGGPLLVYGGGLVAAGLLAADGAAGRLAGRSFSWRQPTAVLLAAAAAAVPVAVAAGWVRDPATGPVRTATASATPLFVTAEASVTGRRVLALSVRPDGRIGWNLLPGGRDPGLLAAAVPVGGVLGRQLDGLVAGLAAGAGGDVTGPLDAADVGFVEVIPAGRAAAQAAATVSDALDGTAGLSRAGAAVWTVVPPPAAVMVLPAGLAAAAASPGPPSVPPPDLTGQVTPLRGRLSESGVTARSRAGIVVPPGPAGRLLVLGTTAEPGWQAELAGRVLPATEAWGWAQAFWLPASGGRLRLTVSAGRHRDLLLAELALLGLALCAALPIRPAAVPDVDLDTPPPSRRTVRLDVPAPSGEVLDLTGEAAEEPESAADPAAEEVPVP